MVNRLAAAPGIADEAGMTLAKPTLNGRGGATRGELKRAARRLFAERGIAAVGMREVVEAAGQRNAAAVHYYFGSKDDLLRELLIDGADLIDDSRQALLVKAEAAGAMAVRDVVRAMVLANIDIPGETGERETYFRFIVNVQNERRALFKATVPEHSTSYARYIAHVRRLLADVPEALINRRLLFAGLSLQTLLAAREAALDGDDPGGRAYWGGEAAFESMIDAVEAILTGPRAACG